MKHNKAACMFSAPDHEKFGGAFREALTFAGPTGQLATMPDMINMRLATKYGDVPWHQGYTKTTLSAEYISHSRAGNLIAIVAHGVGPLSDLKGIIKAYVEKGQKKPLGGTISKEEFLKLESGFYGDVEVIDLAQTFVRHEFPFRADVNGDKIAQEPLWQARLGKRWQEYCDLYDSIMAEWGPKHQVHNVKPGKTPIFYMEGMYEGRFFKWQNLETHIKKMPDMAIARLLCLVGHQSTGNLCSEIHCYDWNNPACFVGMKSPTACELDYGETNKRTCHWL